jgi:hypothetical protein
VNPPEKPLGFVNPGNAPFRSAGVNAALAAPTPASPASTTPTPDIAKIPEELRNTPRWVTWRYEPREKNGAVKWTKVPYNATSPFASPIKADATDPATWTSFSSAVVAEVASRERVVYNGIGLVLDGTDFVVVDLDHVIDSEGKLHQEAERIIREVNSYTEISPSGTGLRIIARAALPRGWRKTSKFDVAIEMYDRERYVTITGRHFAGTPTTVESRTTEVMALHARVAAAISAQPDYRGAALNTDVSDDLGDGWEVDARPTISLGDEEVAGVKDCVLIRLARRNNPERGTPAVFQRGGMLVGMAFPLGDRPKIFVYDSGTMAAYLQREYVWQRVTKGGIKYTEPPHGFVTDVLSQTIYRGIAQLVDVVETPVFASDGSITITPGYHPAAAIWYNPAPGLRCNPSPSSLPRSTSQRRARSSSMTSM